MRVSRYQLRQIIHEAITEPPPYVLERSGVGADERFFVEVTGWRPERIVYGPFEQAKKFPSKISAERVQVTIDEIDGFFTRVQPVSFFQ